MSGVETGLGHRHARKESGSDMKMVEHVSGVETGLGHRHARKESGSDTRTCQKGA